MNFNSIELKFISLLTLITNVYSACFSLFFAALAVVATFAASVVDDVVIVVVGDDEHFAPEFFYMYVRVNLYDS